MIGLTLVALGTSLPELATVVIAAARRQMDVALGNVLGSNILNILAIMGAAAVVAPVSISVPAPFLRLDFPVLMGSTVAIGAFVLLGRRIGRLAGASFLVAYAVYIAVLLGT